MARISALLFIVITSNLQFFQCSAVDKNRFAQSANSFSLGFYSSLVGNNVKDNVVVSPLSVNSILALAAMGAEGKTAEEMFKALKLGQYSEKSKKSAQKKYKTLMKSLYDDTSLNIANKIYAEKASNVNEQFSEITKNVFLSAVESLDFSKAEESAKTINDWVDAHTKHRINDLVTADSFDQQTQMVLLNAVYFKGNWRTKFEKSRTRQRKFWNYGTETVEVPMMFLDEVALNYGYIDELKAKAIELPYDNTNMSMLIILPLDREGLKDIVSNIKSISLDSIMSKLTPNEIWFYMPKFEIEYKANLNEPLKKLGMQQMFSDNADFSNIFTEGAAPKISDVVHKAFIKVDEEGTEAAAATEIQFAPLSALPDFTVDRPFLFLLKTNDNQIVFMGQKTHFD